MFYERSQGLVGICRDAGTNSSRTLTLDLTKFGDNAARGEKRSRDSAITLGSNKKRKSSVASAASPEEDELLQ